MAFRSLACASNFLSDFKLFSRLRCFIARGAWRSIRRRRQKLKSYTSPKPGVLGIHFQPCMVQGEGEKLHFVHIQDQYWLKNCLMYFSLVIIFAMERGMANARYTCRHRCPKETRQLSTADSLPSAHDGRTRARHLVEDDLMLENTPIDYLLQDSRIPQTNVDDKFDSRRCLFSTNLLSEVFVVLEFVTQTGSVGTRPPRYYRAV